MVNHQKQFYFINKTMQAEIELIRQALRENSWLKFEVPIAFIIPRTLSASLFGDSSLRACGGYPTSLWIWWYLSFPDFIVKRTLLHPKNNKDETLISINCVEYVTTIINYCAAITAISESDNIINNPNWCFFAWRTTSVPRIWWSTLVKCQSLDRPLQGSFVDFWLAQVLE